MRVMKMPRYTVRLEFDVDSTDFADIIIDAESVETAKLEAIKGYFQGGYNIDYYASNDYETTLSTENKDDWMVTEHE